jgi:hypothetical protein
MLKKLHAGMGSLFPPTSCQDALEFVDDVVKSSNKIADGPATDDVLK